MVGFGGLAVQESRHLHQPGRLEAGDETCGAGTAEAGACEAGWVGGPRSQGVTVGQKVGEDPLPLGQFGAVDPMLLAGPNAALARHLGLWDASAGPTTARHAE